MKTLGRADLPAAGVRMLFVAGAISIGLTVAAAGVLIFARREDGSGKGMARLSLVLLLSAYGFALAPFSNAVANRHPAGTLLFAVAAAFISLAAALFTRGSFRWLAAGAVVSFLVLVAPILAFFGSGQGVR